MKLISGLAAVALAATTLAQPAAATTPAQAAHSAGDWIAGEVPVALAAGDFTYYPGQLIDAGLGLAATDHVPAAQSAGDALEPLLITTDDNPYGYVHSDEYDWQEPYDYVGVGYYANATAKAAAFTQRIGRDPATQYADVDLLAQLEDLTSDTTGRIEDDSFFGNYANTIGQAFAVEALSNADSPEVGKATDALLAQQCAAGFFPLDLDKPCPASQDQPDVTALAVISLVESGITTPEVASAIDDAADWLESLQLVDGSFPGEGGAAGANTNGTGLGGWALGVAGRTTTAGKAAAWTRALQVSDAGACATKAPTGAIAYNGADFASGRADGIGTSRNKWRIASYQAAPLLNWAPAASTPLAISTPAAATAKSTVTATVKGLAAGEHGCVTFGSEARSVKGTGSDVTETFTLPDGSGTYTFTVTTLSGTQSATTTVPAPATAAPTTSPTPAPAATGPVVGELSAAKVEKVRNNAFTLVVACEGTEACTGKLKVRTAGKVARKDGVVRHLLLAKSAYSVEPGEKAKIKLRLTKPARAAVTSKRVRVKAVQAAPGAESSSTSFWLRRK
jgi:hypothetical protein